MNETKYFNDPQILDYEQLPEPLSFFWQPNSVQRKTTFQQNNKNKGLPILINYGTFATKAGWGNSPAPDLSFRTIVSKNKDNKILKSVLVGNQLKDFDQMKLNYHVPYERNVILHQGILENINDYVFSELGVSGSRVDHPCILTECFANPEYTRSGLLEQMFECYQIPSLLLGVDSLFSYYGQLDYEIERFGKETCLLVDIGFSSIHIIPILKGKVDYINIRRINVGLNNSYELLYKIISLRNSHLKQHLTPQFFQSISENYIQAAFNYQDQLNYLAKGINYADNTLYTNKIQFNNNKIMSSTNYYQNLLEPIVVNFPVAQKQVLSEEEMFRKAEQRKEQAKRLREAILKKKEEKHRVLEKELSELSELQEKIKTDAEFVETQLDLYNFTKFDDIRKRIKALKIKLGLITQEEIDANKYNLISIPDDQLMPDQKRLKKLQMAQKQAFEIRQQKKKEEQKRKQELEELKQQNPQEYIEQLYSRRNQLQTKLNQQQSFQKSSQRSQTLSQKRQQLQTLAQLSSEQYPANSKRKTMEDNFGQNDSDWDVYLQLTSNRDQSSNQPDVDHLVNKINEIECELRELDPDFDEKSKLGAKNPYGFGMEDNRIQLTVERVWPVEVLFQPSMVAIDQSGLTQTIQFILQKYSLEHQQELLSNILIIGGGATIKGIEERIKQDLISLNDQKLEIKVRRAQSPLEQPWKGMQKYWEMKGNQDQQLFIKRNEYQEFGSNFFKYNPFSNFKQQ